MVETWRGLMRHVFSCVKYIYAIQTWIVESVMCDSVYHTGAHSEFIYKFST